MTLVCPQCDLAVVVVDVGDAANETMMCHTTMKPARPMRCWRVYPQPSGAAMVAGALYTDDPTGPRHGGGCAIHRRALRSHRAVYPPRDGHITACRSAPERRDPATAETHR